MTPHATFPPCDVPGHASALLANLRSHGCVVYAAFGRAACPWIVETPTPVAALAYYLGAYALRLHEARILMLLWGEASGARFPREPSESAKPLL
jgi:hypothetical protein